MSLPSSTAASGTPYVGNVDQAAVLANQPNARTDANSAYGQPVASQNVNSSKTPPTTPNNSGTSSPTKKFQPPPRVVPRSPRSLREFAMDSAQQNRDRSGSSPARLSAHSTSFQVSAPPTSPTKLPTTAPTTPTLTPRASARSHVPSLPLSLLTGDATSDESPRTSPTKSKRLKVSLRAMLPLQTASEGQGSVSAPSTTRKGSVSASDPSNKPSTHGADVQASGKKADSEFVALSDEIAGHIVRAIKASGSASKGMRASDAQLFLSQPVKIPVDQFSPELRKRLPASFKESSITHSALINLLYSQAFDKSAAGNQLSAIRRSVMQDYGDATLTMADLAKREEADPGTKKRYVQNMETKARVFADAAFGKASSENPAETFPPELMSLWGAMDSKLVEMKLGSTHRERLAYELVMSRMVLRAAKGGDTEAGLAVPTLFLATIKEVSGKQFPPFASAVLQQFDRERSTPSSTAATGLANLSNSSASSTNSTNNSVSSNNPSQ
ncbi:MAG: hypothetical protein RL678_1298 [Pseudomonadota bacterium]